MSRKVQIMLNTHKILKRVFGDRPTDKVIYRVACTRLKTFPDLGYLRKIDSLGANLYISN